MGQAQQKILTSRELTEKIDELIQAHIALHSAVDHKTIKWAGEQIELAKREIADGLKRLDHNGGMYVVGKDACGKEQQ